MNRLITFSAFAALAALALLLLALFAAIAFGGPGPIAPLASINQPFARADFSAVPPARSYAARDGTALGWLDYPAAASGQDTRRIVLVHGSSARARSMAISDMVAVSGFTIILLVLLEF